MNKYLNIILISFFSVLTYKYNIGFTLYLPIVFFLLFYSEKSIFILIPISLISMFFLANEGFYYTIVFYMFVIIYILFFKKRNNNLLNSILVFLLNYSLLVLINKSFNIIDLSIYLFYSIVSVILYNYFIYNLGGDLIKQNKFRNFGYIEVITGFIIVAGSTTIEIFDTNLALFTSMFYTMYLSQNKYYTHSLFFSLMVTVILKVFLKVEASVMLPFISIFYIFEGMYGSVALVTFLILSYLLDFSLLSLEVIETMLGIILFFELFKYTILSNVSSKKEVIKEIYEHSMEGVNKEIIGFASFLDMFARNFSTSSEFKEKINEAINTLTRNYCETCGNKKECYSNNKGKFYPYFKNLILYSKRSDYDIDNTDAVRFFNKCPNKIQLRRSAVIVNEKLAISKSSTKNNALVAQINGVSQILRQYTVDNSIKSELNFDTFINIKKAICDYGFNLTYFNTKKILENNFLIEIGIRGVNYLECSQIIEKICNNYISCKVTANFVKSERGKTYLNITPKINYKVDYGSGVLAVDGNNVSGDNYLIKQLPRPKLIAAISDGMGKGYTASEESNATLKLVDEVTNVDLATETSLQILNTFYYIQDYLENYSTLDFIEIDENLGEALFYKMGASTSYIFHYDGTFEKIENENLPFGIEEIIETKRLKIMDKDIIILSSDGVFENIVMEDELEKFIRGIVHLSPQKITYEILNYARSHQKKADDDMSVITLKIEKCA